MLAKEKQPRENRRAARSCCSGNWTWQTSLPAALSCGMKSCRSSSLLLRFFHTQSTDAFRLSREALILPIVNTVDEKSILPEAATGLQTGAVQTRLHRFWRGRNKVSSLPAPRNRASAPLSRVSVCLRLCSP